MERYSNLCPIDSTRPTHGNVSRQLGLLTRNQNDRKAVEELTARLREMDPVDPIRYDFSLFGLGAFEKYNRSNL